MNYFEENELFSILTKICKGIGWRNHKLKFWLGLMSFLSGKGLGFHPPREVTSSLCVSLSMCDPSTHSSSPTSDLMMSRARNVSWEGEDNSLLSLFQGQTPQAKIAFRTVCSPQPERARHVPDRLNTQGIWYDYSWEGFFPLPSNPMKPGLAKAVELRDWLNICRVLGG